MDIKLLLDAVLALTSNIAVSDGKELHRNKSVTNIKSKKIENIYHIYSKVNDKNKIHSCHIKFDMLNKKLVGTTCTCETFEEFYKLKNNYVCKHLSATIFSFYLIAKRKLGTPISKIDNKKENAKILNLKIELKEVKENPGCIYEILLKIGVDKIYPILNIKEFINNFINKKNYRVNSDFVYIPTNMVFLNRYKELLYFIYEGLKANTIKLKDSKYILLPEHMLNDFIRLVENDSIVTLHYDFIKYESTIRKVNMPLHFTLKIDKNNLIITSKKKLPEPLSGNFNIFLYERSIFLPSDRQNRLYFPIWEKLMKLKEVKCTYDIDNIRYLLNSINKISSDLQITEGAGKFLRNIWNVNFYFNFNNKNTCTIYIDYLDKTFNILDKASKSLFRDFLYEDFIIMTLERYKFIKEQEYFKFVGNDDELYYFISEGMEVLKSQWTVNYVESNINSIAITGDIAKCNLYEENTNLKFHYGIEGVEFEEYNFIQNAIKDGRKYYKTKSNKILDLRDLGIKSYFNILNHINIENIFTGEEVIEKNKLFFLKKLWTESSLIKEISALELLEENLQTNFECISNTPIGFNGCLREYQIEGVNFLRKLSHYGFGGILADDMGLGKTIQIICFLMTVEFERALIIAPTSLIYNWKDEFNKFAPHFNIKVVHGSKKVREDILKESDNEILITSYGMLKNDIAMYQSVKFDYCIIDEGQNIKNYKSQNALNVKKVNSKVKFALTGTPIENNILELWSIFDFIMEGYLFNIEKFKEMYFTGRNNNIEELKQLIDPFMLRRLKKDVLLELPDKIEKKLYVELSSKEMKEYKNYMKEVKNNLSQGNVDKITILSYITRLRQLCQDPALVNNKYLGESSKINLALNIIDQSSSFNNKVLVFSQYTSILKKMQSKLKVSQIETFYIDGSINPKERIKLVDEFNINDNIKVFLISLKAGGTGLNLTSANVVIHMDPWWNPSIEDQATDRAHRMGQKNVVEVIKLIAKDTIEEKVLNLQEEKRELINLVLNNDDFNANNISKLSSDEILELFI